MLVAMATARKPSTSPITTISAADRLLMTSPSPFCEIPSGYRGAPTHRRRPVPLRGLRLAGGLGLAVGTGSSLEPQRIRSRVKVYHGLRRIEIGRAHV